MDNDNSAEIIEDEFDKEFNKEFNESEELKKLGEDTFDTYVPLSTEPVFLDDVKITKINIKFHGLMPEHEKEAIEMFKKGTPLGEIADHFGMARSDIAYTNK